MSNRTIWNVMKTYNEKGVYYQVLPYNARVIQDILKARGGGLWAVIKFLRNSRWSEEKACRLAKRKNEAKKRENENFKFRT